MAVAVFHGRVQPRSFPHPSWPSVLGDGLLERARSTSLALLGASAAVGLGLTAFALNQGWPLLPGAPIPSLPVERSAIGEAAGGGRAPANRAAEGAGPAAARAARGRGSGAARSRGAAGAGSATRPVRPAGKLGDRRQAASPIGGAATGNGGPAASPQAAAPGDAWPDNATSTAEGGGAPPDGGAGEGDGRRGNGNGGGRGHAYGKLESHGGGRGGHGGRGHAYGSSSPQVTLARPQLDRPAAAGAAASGAPTLADGEADRPGGQGNGHAHGQGQGLGRGRSGS
jgi:hypothetical protein